jgi:hypothetical protein
MGKGGFLFLDDLTFSNETPQHMELAIARTEAWMQRVLPESKLVPIPASDPIFDGFFQIDPADVPRGGTPTGGTLYGIYRDGDPNRGLMAVVTSRGARAQLAVGQRGRERSRRG